MPAGGQRRRMLMAARRGRRARPRRRMAVLARWRDWPGASSLVRWWGGVGRRGRIAVLSAVAVALAACVVLVLVVARGPQSRARQYLAFTACLLTDAHGLTGTQAAPAWAGLEDASLATHAKVEYLPVTTGSTAAAAAPFLASMVARQCQVVVAAGQAQVAAVLADAGHYPDVTFAVVGGAGAAGKPREGRNVTVVGGSPDAVRSAVAGLVTSAVGAAS